MPKVPKTPLDIIIPLYRKRVLQRANENEAALRASGAYSPAEFNDLKDRMLKAYTNISRTSAPVINVKAPNLLKFLKSGEYRNLGSDDVTDYIKYDIDARRCYSNDVYGYDQLPGAEKYGTVPMDELSGDVDIERQGTGVTIPGAEYGAWRMHLKPNMKRYSTINAFDSMNQWSDNAPWLPHRDIYPVPYVPDDPEAYVGGLMDAPSPTLVADYLDNGWTQDAINNETRVRNDETLRLLEGRLPSEYIESHVHGPIYRDDIDFIEVLGNADMDAARELSNRYNMRFVPAAEYRSPRPLDSRRELESRPTRFEQWMRGLQR